VAGDEDGQVWRKIVRRIDAVIAPADCEGTVHLSASRRTVDPCCSSGTVGSNLDRGQPRSISRRSWDRRVDIGGGSHRRSTSLYRGAGTALESRRDGITSDQHKPSANGPCTCTALRAFMGVVGSALVSSATEKPRRFIVMMSDPRVGAVDGHPSVPATTERRKSHLTLHGPVGRRSRRGDREA